MLQAWSDTGAGDTATTITAPSLPWETKSKAPHGLLLARDEVYSAVLSGFVRALSFLQPTIASVSQPIDVFHFNPCLSHSAEIIYLLTSSCGQR